MNLPRRHFGIRESAFVLLNFFDLSSYSSRKNPEAVLALLDRIRRDDPYRDVQVVLKVKNGERGAEDWAASMEGDPQVKVIATPLDTLGVRSLMAACDCFVSLHRAEGFGRGMGEAMALGRLTMGTGWSGNVDFMTDSNSLLVGHELVRLQPDAYPHWQGQSWAEPDVDHAGRCCARCWTIPTAAPRSPGAGRWRRCARMATGRWVCGFARLERIAATGLTGRAVVVSAAEPAVKGKGGRGGKRSK